VGRGHRGRKLSHAGRSAIEFGAIEDGHFALHGRDVLGTRASAKRDEIVAAARVACARRPELRLIGSESRAANEKEKEANGDS